MSAESKYPGPDPCETYDTQHNLSYGVVTKSIGIERALEGNLLNVCWIMQLFAWSHLIY